MAEGLEHIGKKSVVWSYAAVFFSVGAGVILLPFILHAMPSETVAVWNIFQAIYSLTVLMDFGFRPSFARNLSYIFSGVKELKKTGVSEISNGSSVDYTLLKSTIGAMKLFYRWLALAVLALLGTIGTAYFLFLMSKYSGDRTDATVAWCMHCLINSYNLYTLYYDSLLTGKGYVRQLQQITIAGQSVYIVVAIAMIYAGFGLTAIVCAQTISILIKRFLAYRTFHTPEMDQRLAAADEQDPKEILHVIMPNAVKVGLTQLGGFVVTKSALFFGSIYIALSDMAVYGVSVQIVDILARCGTILYVTYSPRLAKCRAERNLSEIKRLYALCVEALVVIYVVGGCVILFMGNSVLDLLGSNTHLLPMGTLALLLGISLLEQNHIIAAGIIQADNKIPFFKPSIISGAFTVIAVWLMLDILSLGVVGLILAPGIVQLAYQNWKWPSVVIKELKGV